MKFTTGLFITIVSLIAPIPNVDAAPELVTILYPTPTRSGQAVPSVVAGGVDGNGHTTYIFSGSENVVTAVAGASYVSYANLITPNPGPSEPVVTKSVVCSAVDGENGLCVGNAASFSESRFTFVPFTTTIHNGKAVINVTSTLPQSASAASAGQGSPNSANAGAWIGISAVFSSAILSGLGFLLF